MREISIVKLWKMNEMMRLKFKNGYNSCHERGINEARAMVVAVMMVMGVMWVKEANPKR